MVKMKWELTNWDWKVKSIARGDADPANSRDLVRIGELNRGEVCQHHRTQWKLVDQV